MRTSRKSNSGNSAAFTLIELITVVTIMGILLTMGTYMATDSTNAMKLTKVAQTLTQELSQARQHAMTKNREVEFRIYKSDPHDEGTEGYRSYAFGVVEVISDPTDPDYQDPLADDFAPPFALVRGESILDEGYEFLEISPYSTLISGIAEAKLDIRRGTETREEEGETLEYVAFVFQPEGSAWLDESKHWTLTAIRVRDSKDGDSELRKNFATIQLQPQSGRARLYRP